MTVTERALADGTIVYDVREYVGFTRDGRPDRTCVTCRTKAEARVEQAKLVALRDGMRNRSGRCTFGQYVDGTFWPACDGLEASSRATYERELRLRLKPAFEHVDIRDIDRPRIQRMVDGCATESVARKALGLLKTILNEAKGDGLIISNPAEARYRMPPPGKRRDNGIVVTTFADMAPLLAAVEDYGDDSIMKIAFLGLLMGLRPEERYGLDDAEVDGRAGTVLVRQAYTPSSAAEGGNNLKGTKTDRGERLLPMTEPFRRRLPMLARNPGGPFVLGSSGARISPSTAQHRWARFLRWCSDTGREVPPVTIENMRHSFATSYIHAGGAVADLSVILGHADVNTTLRRYVRPCGLDVARGMGAVPSI
nr:MAG TPA: Integrase [Caudoviricetes sp.]